VSEITGTLAAPALEATHISAAYGPYRALFDVSLSVPAKGVVALLGSNGAGKSTLARVVSGLLPATSGSIRVGGTDVTGEPAYRIARAGMAHVPEGRGIFANLTVEENLVLCFRQRVGRGSVPEALERTYAGFPVLGERRKQRGGTLSGGQQRLLSLAKVLVVPPRILMADELSLGLAPVVIDAIYEGLRAVNQAGTALLVVEQQVERALEMAADAVVLEHGSVAFAGPSSEAMGAVEAVMAARGSRTAQPAVAPGKALRAGDGDGDAGDDGGKVPRPSRRWRVRRRSRASEVTATKVETRRSDNA